MTISKWLWPDSLPYDTARDFVAVGAIAWAHQVLAVRMDLPVSNLQEFLAYGRRPNSKRNYDYSGNGATLHLVISQFLHQTNIKAEHFRFQGGSQALTSLIGDQIDFISDNEPVVQAALASGRVKAFAVTSDTRIPSMPDVADPQGARH